jgi:aryl-alcohol dehydrogenase-like predicted oxidoreductase
VEHADALKPLVSQGMTMAEMAIRFILSNPDISTTIPGMRRIANVDSNMGCSDGKGLPTTLLDQLKDHRWDRTPTEWSQ